MRLTVQQMRFIRETNMKRAEWVGKSFVVVHEHLGEIYFGKRPKGKR